MAKKPQDPRRRVNMQTANIRARMTNPAMVLPNAMRALLALGKSPKKAGVLPWTVLLVHLRASQIRVSRTGEYKR